MSGNPSGDGAAGAAAAAAAAVPSSVSPVHPPPPARRKLRVRYAAHPSVARFVRGGGGSYGQVLGVLLVDAPPIDFDVLAEALRHKLRLKKNKAGKKKKTGAVGDETEDIRLFVTDAARAGGSGAVSAAAELTPGGGASAHLTNGCAVTVVAAAAAAKLLKETKKCGGRDGESGDDDSIEEGSPAGMPMPPIICVPRSLDKPVGKDAAAVEKYSDGKILEEIKDNGEAQTDTIGVEESEDHYEPDDEAREAKRIAAPSIPCQRLAPPPSELRFSPSGRFPVLEGNVLPLLRKAIGPSTSSLSSPFVERNHGCYISFDYRDAAPSAFPDPFERGGGRIKTRDRWMFAARRECRGLLVSAVTGEVIARRFHKFFNVDEVEETGAGAVGAALASSGGWKNLSVTEKVDGSLVSPFLLPSFAAVVNEEEDGNRPEPELKWATRSSVDDGIAHFVASRQGSIDYNGLARKFLSQKKTPLFEWCEARKAVGVIRHKQSSLTLLAVRDNVTGEYLPREEWGDAVTKDHSVPVVRQVKIAELTSEAAFNHDENDGDDDGGKVRAIVHAVRSVSGGGNEGVVLSTSDGLFFKIKTCWYVAMAGASRKGGSGSGAAAFLAEVLRRRPTLADVPLGRLLAACLGDGADDAVALCAGLLADRGDEGGEKEAAELRTFRHAVAEATGRLRVVFRRWGEDVRRWRPEVPPRTKALWAAQLSRHSSDDNTAPLAWSTHTFIHYACGRAAEGDAALSMDLRQIAGFEGEGGGDGADALTGLLGFEWDAKGLACHGCDGVALRWDRKGEDEIASLWRSKGRGGDVPTSDALVDIAEEFANFELERPQGKKLARRIREHVCENYLPRKMATYLGLPTASVLDDTVFRIDHDYSPNEGKIQGMWERFHKDGIVDLRVDLQPRLAKATTHCGDDMWALWAVQFGPSTVCKRSTRPRRGLASGEFAAVMVRTDHDFKFGDLRRAVSTSFDTGHIVKLMPPNLHGPEAPSVRGEKMEQTKTSEGCRWRIFCDLDGVLADFDSGLVAVSGKRPCDFPSRGRMWQQIASHRRFFETLPWTEDGEALWSFLSSGCADVLSSPPTILTGLPDAKSVKKAAARQKHAWCASKLGDNVGVITCRSAEKWSHSAPRHILIDDHLEHKTHWEQQGGIFIHHISVPQTIRALRTLMFPNGGLSPEERTAASKLCRVARGSCKQNFSVDPNDIIQVIGGVNDACFAEAVKQVPTHVAIDVEWRPDELVSSGARSAASLIQFAIDDNVFVVDTESASPCTQRATMNLLGDAKIAKLFFGLEEDFLRLVASMPTLLHGLNAVPGVVDLQACLQALVFPEERNKVALSDAAERVIGLNMTKSKALQASDWAKRPLTAEQLQYAACDAAVLQQIWRILSSHPCLLAAAASMTHELPLPTRADLRPFKVQMSSSSVIKPEQQSLADPTTVLSIAPAGGVDVVHVSLFLTAESKRRLLEAYPPRNRNVIADHITLMHSQRDMLDFAGFPVGRPCRVQILEEVADEFTQAIRVRIEDPLLEGFVQPDRELHVTLSTAANTAASRSNDLLATYREEGKGGGAWHNKKTEGDAIFLDAIVGLKVSLDHQQSSLADLDSRLIKKLTDFVENGEPGSNIKFRGGELTGSERAVVHEFASNRGIESRSEGPSEKRVLILSLPKFARGNSVDEDTPFQGRIVANAADLEGKKGKSTRDKHRQRLISTSRIVLSQDVFTAMEFKRNLDVRRSAEVASMAGRLVDGFSGRPEILWDHSRNPRAGSPEAILRSIFTLGEQHRESSEETGKLLFILRGVPGSGKSTLSSLLVQALGGADNVAVCSADRFFELGAGARRSQKPSCSGVSTYLECYDEKKVREAHDYCRQCFLESLLCPHKRAVIVDNTNARQSEYQWYLKQDGVGNSVIVEIVCQSQEQLRTFQERSVHRVPWQAAARIYANMEVDKDAVLLQPHHDLQQRTVAHVADGAVSLRQWLTEHHYFHNVASRPKSHLIMSSSSAKRRAGAKFLNIPAALYNEFLDRYACDTSPWFLAEVATRPYFRLFFDCDVILEDNEPAVNEMEVAKRLHMCLDSIGAPRQVVVVVGRGRSEPYKRGKQKQCFHLHCPTVIVDVKNAHLIRQMFVTFLQKAEVTRDWDSAIDEEVFVGDVALRMHGSRKPDSDNEDGRVYHFVGQLDRNGELDCDAMKRYESNPTALLEATSIRARPGDRPTQGLFP